MRSSFSLWVPVLLIWMIVWQSAGAQICKLSDEFDGTSLHASWQQYQPSYHQVQVLNGYLTLDVDASNCNNNCPWFHSQSAGFIYKEIAGNFDLISVVEAEEASGANIGEDISNDTQLGGLMARNGNSATENYVFNVVGTRFDLPSIETKSTTNDNSGTIEHFEILTTRAELRMTREGSTFRLYSRDLGATEWIHRSTFERTDLPDTLQVGVIAYAFQSYPEDLLVKIDYVRYSDFNLVNKWLGGTGMWHDVSMWSANMIPDSSHNVIIDNSQQQTIQILPGESFSCSCLDIHSNLTEFVVDGQLNVGLAKVGCK